MNRDFIKNKIIDIITDNLFIDKNTINEDSIIDIDLDIDSLDLYYIIGIIENDFNIHFSFEIIDRIYDVSDLINYVNNIKNNEKY